MNLICIICNVFVDSGNGGAFVVLVALQNMQLFGMLNGMIKNTSSAVMKTKGKVMLGRRYMSFSFTYSVSIYLLVDFVVIALTL